jgi:hypothetical protein
MKHLGSSGIIHVRWVAKVLSADSPIRSADWQGLSSKTSSQVSIVAACTYTLMKKWPWSDNYWIALTAQNARSSAPVQQKTQRKGNTQLTKTSQMHEALRLCMEKWLWSNNGWITLAAQNARNTAPVHHKQPSAREMRN